MTTMDRPRNRTNRSQIEFLEARRANDDVARAVGLAVMDIVLDNRSGLSAVLRLRLRGGCIIRPCRNGGTGEAQHGGDGKVGWGEARFVGNHRVSS